MRNGRTTRTAALTLVLAMTVGGWTATGAQAAATGAITGLVVDDTGAPVVGAYVRVEEGAGSGTTDASGRYRIPSLAAGTYHVRFAPPAGSNLVFEYFADADTVAESAPVAVADGQTVDGVDAELATGGLLAGRMIGTDGTPVVHEDVYVYGPDATDVTHTVTDSDGTFVVDGRGDRPYRIHHGSRAGEVHSLPQPYTVQGRAGADVIVPDDRLTWSGMVDGTVTDDTGAPVADVQVRLESVYTPGYVVASAWTDEDGYYQVRGFGTGWFYLLTHATVTPSGLGSSVLPTYWLEGSPVGTQDRDEARGVATSSAEEPVTGADIEIPRRGDAVADLRPEVLHDFRDWSTVTVDGSGAAVPPSGLVEVRSRGYRYGAFWLDGEGRGRFPVGLGWQEQEIELVYSGDPQHAPSRVVVRPEEFVAYPPTHGIVASEPRRLTDVMVEPGVPTCTSVGGRWDLPRDATGVMLNVTAVGPTGPGYVVLYPDTDDTGSTPPPAEGATVNFEVGKDVSNAALVALSSSGRLCWASPPGAGRTRLVVDIAGYVAADAGVQLRSHTRLLDTRHGTALAPRAPRTVEVAGRAGVPQDATAVLLNVAVTRVGAVGHLRVLPEPGGETVTAHYVPGVDKSVAALAPLGEDGTLTLYSDSSRPVDVVLDVVGWVTDGGVYHPLAPARVLDTRPGAPVAHRRIAGPLQANQVYGMELRGAGGVPADATGAVLSVTAIAPTSVGNLSVYPDTDGTGQTPRPDASNINYVPGRAIPNMVVVEIPPDGRVNLVSQAPPGGLVNVAVEVVGYVTD